MVKISPELVTSLEQGKSSGRVGTFSLRAGVLWELIISPVLDKIQDYKRNWIQHVNRMPRKRLHRIIKNYTPKVEGPRKAH